MAGICSAGCSLLQCGEVGLLEHVVLFFIYFYFYAKLFYLLFFYFHFIPIISATSFAK